MMIRKQNRIQGKVLTREPLGENNAREMKIANEEEGALEGI